VRLGHPRKLRICEIIVQLMVERFAVLESLLQFRFSATHREVDCQEETIRRLCLLGQNDIKVFWQMSVPNAPKSTESTNPIRFEILPCP